MKNFALIGAAGYVAPRHMKAIKETGNRLIAAVDPCDSIGVLDHYFLDARYFSEIERFDRHLEKLRRAGEENRVHYISICSPNYLHDAHIRLALRVGADVICEKPLVINPWNLDQIEQIESETGHRVNTVLQLRLHPALIELKKKLDSDKSGKKRDAVLTYVTGRGPWYRVSWKGVEDRSGGLATNIGIHLFDLLMWLFGPIEKVELHLKDQWRMSGLIELQRATVRWFLSVDLQDLPFGPKPGEMTTYRSLAIDGAEVEFSEGFANLHTTVYQETLAGRGFGVADARPAIELVHRIRNCEVSKRPDVVHPALSSQRTGK